VNLINLPRGDERGKSRHLRRTPASRLFMALVWLRRGCKFQTLAEDFNVSRSTVSRELRHIMPILFCNIKHIKWPECFDSLEHAFEHVVGAIDCSSHFRWRVHPGQVDYYRGDKHAHFLSAEVVCSLDGNIWQVILALGHNNDRGVFKERGTKEFVEEKHIKLLADRGYSHANLVTPQDDLKSESWNNVQKGLRSVVESVFARVHIYAITSPNNKFKLSPEMQQLVLIVCYNLSQIMIEQFPIRVANL